MNRPSLEETLYREVPPSLLRAAPQGDLWWVMFDASPVACSIVDIASGTLVVNRAYRTLMGIPDGEEVTMEDVRRRAHPAELDELNRRFGALDRGEVDRVELDRRYVRDDGSVIWGHLVTTLVRGHDGEPVAVVGQMEDITERIEQLRTIRFQAALLDEQNRRLSEQAEQLVTARDAAVESSRLHTARFEAGFEHSPIGIAVVDARGLVCRVNPALCRMLDEGSQDLTGRSLRELIEPDTPADAAALDEICGHRRVTYAAESRCRRRDGTTVWADVHVARLADERGRPLGFFAQLQDITDRRSFQQALAHQASHDPLTGLTNRHHFLFEAGRIVSRARGPGDDIALLFIDVDRFKAVNDSLGHAVGDRLLRELATRLAAALPEAEIARLGGDEFAVMAAVPRRSPQAAQDIADRLHAASAPAFDLAGRELRVSLSIGIVCCRERDFDTEELLQQADVAMYRAKSAGGATSSFT